MESASSRLRQAFRYNGDGDDAPIEGVDEEEQEKIITSIEDADTASNVVFKGTIVAIAVLAVLYTLLVERSLGLSLRFLRSILCLHALVVALDIRARPLSQQPWNDKRPFNMSHSVERWLTDRAFPTGVLKRYEAHLSMIGYILCIAVVVSEYVARTADRGLHWTVTTIHMWFPVALFGVIQVAKFELQATQAGIAELKKMKYEYRGA